MQRLSHSSENHREPQLRLRKTLKVLALGDFSEHFFEVWIVSVFVGFCFY